MVYGHKIKCNGKWYMPGEEVPEIIPATPDQKDLIEKAYTKTEIMRMSTADLQALATEHGMDNAKEITGAELKKLLVEKLGL